MHGHCWLGDMKGIRPVKQTGCWFVGGDDLIGALHILYLQLSPPPPSPLASIKSRMERFWYWLTHVHWKMAIKRGREGGKMINYELNKSRTKIPCRVKMVDCWKCIWHTKNQISCCKIYRCLTEQVWSYLHQGGAWEVMPELTFLCRNHWSVVKVRMHVHLLLHWLLICCHHQHRLHV